MISFKQYIFESKFPLITFKELYHVGNMNIKNKKGGFEGSNGLSVSTTPDSWRKINRGHTTGDTYRLTKQNNSFLNYHKLTKKQKQEIFDWAEQSGYATTTTKYQVCWYDDEYEEEMCFEYDDYDEAKSEADGYETDVKIIKDTYTGTNKMKQRIGGTDISLMSVLYAEDVLGIDGVYWTDIHDISKLSAPRGTIVSSMIKSWKLENLGYKMIGNEEEE